jgi:bacillithiol biosynthesis cysteine-adding enzyme BshC
MRIVATPLRPLVDLPAPRHGGVPPELLDAIVDAPGTGPLRERLLQPGLLLVTTGQQPGLFTGPLYTVYKALSAAALARQLERLWQRPVAPLFWVAGDDHDFAEARSASWLDAGSDLRTAELAPRPDDAPLLPMYRQPLGPEIAALLADFEQSLPASPHRDATVGWLRRHYGTGGTVGGAFAGALAELLAPFGIACLDSTHVAVKRAMGPLLGRALAEGAEIEELLRETGRVLELRGQPAPVPIGGGASLVFLEGPAGRDRLVAEGDGFVARRAGSRHALAELIAIASSEPQRLSPNVLLRPVLESALFPTVAYVAGPGELAYLPMCEPLYAHLGVPRQVPVPRWSGILVEPRVDRVMAKFGASLEELLTPGAVLESRVIKSQMPEALATATANLRRHLDREYGVIREAAAAIDPTLERPVDAVHRHGLTELADLEKKVEGHLRRREATELAQIARARSAVLPAGAPQERVLTAAGWLARFGEFLLRDVSAAIDSWYAAALAGRGPVS